MKLDFGENLFNNYETTSFQKSPDLPRAFRWSLRQPGHEKTYLYQLKFKANYKDKTAEIEIYEDPEGKVYEWMKEILSGQFTFSIDHFDSSGRVIFTNTYSGAEVKYHEVEYDNTNNDVLKHIIKLNYTYLTRL